MSSKDNLLFPAATGDAFLTCNLFGLSDMAKRDKRTRERYSLRLPVQVTWEDAFGNAHGETTTTLDINVSGCFIVCHHLIQKGRRISVEIDLSIAEAGIFAKRVSAQGRVVRNVPVAANPGGGFGHGVRFDRFRFSKQ
ncbi:MAG: PilZ domain-containing protein [Thermodesulfobacteriota bacterium]|nr:PilZ domain-containing protein [Thermodesulfobacteriota bacterium]